MRNWIVLAGAALIAVAIYAASFTNRYEIAENAQGGNTVWRLDKRTGATDVCYFAKSDDPFEGVDADFQKIKCANYVGHKTK